MKQAETLVEVWRGDILESVHQGHAVVMDSSGGCVESWGEATLRMLPRSSCKMLQAMPLVLSGAADKAGLTQARLALACASHSGAPIHVHHVQAWLGDLSLEEGDLRCGPEASRDKVLRHAMIRDQRLPGQIHNNCSGKHSGFLTLTQHLKAGPEYLELDHPVQKAVLEAFETATGEASQGYGIDGCSAPNFATSLAGLAMAMARFAGATDADSAGAAMLRLRNAMLAHPDLVAGEGRACTNLMRACAGRTVVKTGAEGVYTAILPERGFGIALKIADGATRAAETAIAALLVRYGALDATHPEARALLKVPIANRRGLRVGDIRPAQALV